MKIIVLHKRKRGNQMGFFHGEPRYPRIRIFQRIRVIFSGLLDSAIFWAADISIILLNLIIKRKEATMSLIGDFDRGLVKMACIKKECSYKLPHYHCEICGSQVNSDELRRDYHPCCSLECIKIYNLRFDHKDK